jgi:hypothetical protein
VAASRLLIKQAELEAERVQQQCMYQQSLRPEVDIDADAGEMLEHNLQQFAVFQGIEVSRLAGFCRLAKPGFKSLKADLIAP